MNEEQQRIKIAEACRWNKRTMAENGPLVWHDGEKFRSDYEIPDYPNDLNAMHEAEKVLASRDEYVVLLRKACGGFNPVFATAAQRAEAFLKTLNLWT